MYLSQGLHIRLPVGYCMMSDNNIKMLDPAIKLLKPSTHTVIEKEKGGNHNLQENDKTKDRVENKEKIDYTSKHNEQIGMSRQGANDKEKIKAMKEEIQQACIRGLRDATGSKKSINTMPDALSEDDNSSTDDLSNNSTFDSLEGKDKRDSSFNETHGVSKMTIKEIEEEMQKVKMEEKNSKEEIYKEESGDVNYDSLGYADLEIDEEEKIKNCMNQLRLKKKANEAEHKENY